MENYLSLLANKAFFKLWIAYRYSIVERYLAPALLAPEMIYRNISAYRVQPRFERAAALILRLFRAKQDEGIFRKLLGCLNISDNA